MVELRDGDPPPQTLSLVASLALAEAIDVAVPGQPLLLKWPNDLLLNGAKLAGILLERRDGKVVIGIGVNLAHAPRIDDRRTGDLQGKVTVEDFAPVLASKMARMLGLWRSSTPMLFAQAWLARAHPLGSTLQVHGEDHSLITGTFDGIDSDGSLRLRLPSGELRTIYAGDVSLG